VRDHVELLLIEGATGSIFLWDWLEADVSARVALRVVHELEARGHQGPNAVWDFQQDVSSGYTGRVDGLVGPATCAALNVTVPQGVVWHS
jgi:lysozyme family protein